MSDEMSQFYSKQEDLDNYFVTINPSLVLFIF